MPGFVSGTWILNSSRSGGQIVACWWDTGFFELFSVFQSPGFRIPDSTSTFFSDSGFHKQKLPTFRNPDSLTWVKRGYGTMSPRDHLILSQLMQCDRKPERVTVLWHIIVISINRSVANLHLSYRQSKLEILGDNFHVNISNHFFM